MLTKHKKRPFIFMCMQNKYRYNALQKKEYLYNY